MGKFYSTDTDKTVVSLIKTKKKNQYCELSARKHNSNFYWMPVYGFNAKYHALYKSYFLM